jgi:hypothetical protein
MPEQSEDVIDDLCHDCHHSSSAHSPVCACGCEYFSKPLKDGPRVKSVPIDARERHKPKKKRH